MTYSITPSVDRKYIIIKTFGDINRALALQQNVEAQELGKKLGIHCYLGDLTESRNTDSVVDTYEFANQDMQNNPEIDHHVHVALVIRPDDHSHDFYVLAAKNAGLNIRLFQDRNEAIEYLLRKADAVPPTAF